MKLDHVAVPVSDPTPSRRFYETAFGAELVTAMHGDDWGGLPWLLMFFRLESGGFIALSCFKGAGVTPAAGLPVDARHIALGVEDLKPWRTRLKKHRIAFWEEDHGPQRSLFVTDPDGNAWEIAAPPGKGLSGLHDAEAAETAIAAFLAARP